MASYRQKNLENGSVEENLPVREEVFSGTYYEIGLKLGKRLEGIEIPPYSREKKKFALACEAVLREVHTALLDKVQGIIDGVKSTGGDFKTYLYARKGGRDPGCTNVVVLPPFTSSGEIIVGCNYDWYYSALKWCELRRMKPKGAIPSISYTHHWAGGQNSMNAEGLFVAISALPRIDAELPGLQWHFIIDILLDSCGKVEDAVDLLTSIPHLNSIGYLVADGSGKASIVEARPKEVRVRAPENGVLIGTNHLVRYGKWPEELPAGIKLTQTTSVERYNKVKELVTQKLGTIDERMLIKILKNHDGHICLGKHEYDADDDPDSLLGTIWSLIGKPGRREVHVSPGHPCRSVYHRFVLE